MVSSAIAKWANGSSPEPRSCFSSARAKKTRRDLMGFRSPVGGGPLEAVANPLLGRDVLELRVKDPAQGNPETVACG